MVNRPRSEDTHSPMAYENDTGRLPRPTARFRLRAWRDFQRALDPLGPAKPLRPPRQT
jgi:hypothetical protein